MGVLAAWRGASRVIAEAPALVCLPCNGTPGPCTCPRRRTDCRCGHPRDAHEHYRDGSDCGSCGRAFCRRYRRPFKIIFWRRT